MNTYLWCEDTKSGLEFWRFIIQMKAPHFIVEGKGGISSLRRAVSRISDSKDRFLIVLDYAFDNPDSLREVNAISRLVEAKNNVKLIKLHSFEYILLSFDLLDSWIFAEQDDLKEKRKLLLEIRDGFVKMISEGLMSDALEEGSPVRSFLNENNYNTEQAAFKLLFAITRNTGFETSKSHLGSCFRIDCCSWENRKDDDICGLDDLRITSSEKADLIIKHSVLNTVSGLEELLND